MMNATRSLVAALILALPAAALALSPGALPPTVALAELQALLSEDAPEEGREAAVIEWSRRAHDDPAFLWTEDAVFAADLMLRQESVRISRSAVSLLDLLLRDHRLCDEPLFDALTVLAAEGLLARALHDPRPDVRRLAVSAVGSALGATDARWRDVLEHVALNDPDERVRENAQFWRADAERRAQRQ